MPEIVTAAHPIIETLTAQFGFAQWAAIRNLDGITDEEALLLPQPGGNSINWIAGHLVTARQGFIKAFGQDGVLSSESSVAYRRGTAPGETMPETVTTLRDALTRTHDLFLALIAGFDEATMAKKAPFSPGNDPNETVGSLLGKLVVHEGYHAGQIGMARRLIGKPGAIQ